MIIIKTIVFLIIVPASVTILFPYFLLTSKFKLFFPDIGIFHFLGLIPILIGVVGILFSPVKVHQLQSWDAQGISHNSRDFP